MHATCKFWKCCSWVKLILRPVFDTSDHAEDDRQYKKNKIFIFEVYISCLVNMSLKKSENNIHFGRETSCMWHMNFGHVAVE